MEQGALQVLYSPNPHGDCLYLTLNYMFASGSCLSAPALSTHSSLVAASLLSWVYKNLSQDLFEDTAEAKPFTF